MEGCSFFKILTMSDLCFKKWLFSDYWASSIQTESQDSQDHKHLKAILLILSNLVHLVQKRARQKLTSSSMGFFIPER